MFIETSINSCCRNLLSRFNIKRAYGLIWLLIDSCSDQHFRHFFVRFGRNSLNILLNKTQVCPMSAPSDYSKICNTIDTKVVKVIMIYFVGNSFQIGSIWTCKISFGQKARKKAWNAALSCQSAAILNCTLSWYSAVIRVLRQLEILEVPTNYQYVKLLFRHEIL